MEKECKFSYNEMDDSLILSCRDEDEKSSENFIMDGIIFHLNESGKIIGLHILNTSEVLNDSGIDPEILEDIKSITLNITPKENCLFIGINIANQEQGLKFPLGRIFIPEIHQTNLSP